MDAIAGGKVEAAVDRSSATRRNAAKRCAPKAMRNSATSSPAPATMRPPIATTIPSRCPRSGAAGSSPNISAEHIFPYINPDALFSGQWGFKQKGSTAERVRPTDRRKSRAGLRSPQAAGDRSKKLIEPKVVYGYFPVQSEGDDLIVYHTEEFPAAPATPTPANAADAAASGCASRFPRQNRPPALVHRRFLPHRRHPANSMCSASSLSPSATAPPKLAEKLRQANKYQDYLYLHGFGVESAEALAEFWHKRMRQELGFGSEDAAEHRRAVPPGISRQPLQLRLPRLSRIWKTALKSSNCCSPKPSACSSARTSCSSPSSPPMRWSCIIRRRSILMREALK